MRSTQRRPSKHDRHFIPSRVVLLDLDAGPLRPVALRGHHRALVVLRAAGQPVGTVRIWCDTGWLQPAQVERAIERDAALRDRLRRVRLVRWLLQQHPRRVPALRWSAIVCTRERPEPLAVCVRHLLQARVGEGEIIVVDNAPITDATRRVAARYPVRYVVEPRRGLNWARACGARAARGDVLLYTDDDVRVDPGWIPALLEPFAAPRVGAVTGLTLPWELETPAQELFEFYGGHGRGFERRVFDATVLSPAAAGRVGSGASMAFRKSLAVDLGLFDCELDVGTVTRSGGDAYAFYRVLAAGYQIVYTPAALAWHLHRRDYPSLRRMLRGYSVGGFAFLTRCLVRDRDWQAAQVALAWLRRHHVTGFVKLLLRRPDALPADLVMAEWQGAALGPWAYWRSRWAERAQRHHQEFRHGSAV